VQYDRLKNDNNLFNLTMLTELRYQQISAVGLYTASMRIVYILIIIIIIIIRKDKFILL